MPISGIPGRLVLAVLALFVAACSAPAPSGLQPSTAQPSASAPSSPAPSAPAPSTPAQAEPATVQVEYDAGERWQAVSALTSHVPAGSAAVRLHFSKPVRQGEVERALIEGQGAFVRGLMQWQDEQTLIWSLPQLPSRLDFLLDGAHDADGLPLPGGIMSLRAGQPPQLVELDLAAQAEVPVAVLPPDVAAASLSPDGQYINVAAWRPGVSRWDWQTTDWYLSLADPVPKPGRMQGPQPRLVGDLESWVPNPGGTLIAGFRPSTGAAGGSTGTADLVVRDLGGGREQVFRNFAAHTGPAAEMAYLAWSADGMKVLALSDTPAGLADVVVLDFATRQKTTVARDLPLRAAGARLAWAPDGRWLLAGALVVDLESGEAHALPGGAPQARGAWEPGGTRLLYTARDWDEVLLLEPAGGEPRSLGPALLVDWGGQDRLYLIRWPASDSRYVPPGG